MENRMALARVRQDVVLHRYYGTGLSSEMGRGRLSVGGVGWGRFDCGLKLAPVKRRKFDGSVSFPAVYAVEVVQWIPAFAGMTVEGGN